ncbi:MAG: hypothetical protein ABI763_14000 [Bacteroidota bacterium]
MKITVQKVIPFLVIIIFFSVGCQKEELLMSSSKVDGQLQSTWKRVEMTSANTPIVSWTFSDGKVSVVKNETVLASGSYKVDASLTKVFVTTSGFPSEGYNHMNGKWQVITLDDDILVMADDYSGGSIEMEFTKEK